MSSNLANLERLPVSKVLEGLKAENSSASQDAASKLILKAQSFGLNLPDYLRLAVDTKASPEDANRYAGCNGFEAALTFLNLPLSNDLDSGVMLKAAADTFATYTGTRALFPAVMDELVRSKTRQEMMERTETFVSQSRGIDGIEMVSTFLEDDSTDSTFIIAEGGRIPIRKIGTSESGIKIWKHGMGYEWTYEFNRRASLDIITPYASRLMRRVEISKVAAATTILLNGDGVNGAASSANITDAAYGGSLSGGKTLKDNYVALSKWIMSKWKAGYPIDTLLVNFNTYVELMLMFAPVLGQTSLAKEMPNQTSMPTISTNLPIFNGKLTAELSSTMPDDKIIGLIKGECLEELVENGSKISESETAIKTQTVTYVNTENTGYKLVFADARYLLNIA